MKATDTIRVSISESRNPQCWLRATGVCAKVFLPACGGPDLEEMNPAIGEDVVNCWTVNLSCPACKQLLRKAQRSERQPQQKGLFGDS